MPDNKVPNMQADLSNFDPFDYKKSLKFSDTNSEEYANLKKWYDLRLRELWFLALGRDELKDAFCATAKSLKEKPGLRDKIGKIWLLEHFALCTNYGDKPEEVLTQLHEYIYNVYGTYLEKRTINNLISESIREIELDDLPEWTHNAINKRRKLGKKLHKK